VSGTDGGSTVCGRILANWVAFAARRRPRTEPPIWHSHISPFALRRDALKVLGNHFAGVIIDIGAGTGHGEAYLDEARQFIIQPLPNGRDARTAYFTLKAKRLFNMLGL